MTHPRLNWLRHLVIPAGIILLDVCWIYPWSALIGQWLQPGALAVLSAPLMLLLVASAFAAMRLLQGRIASLRWLRATLAGAGLLIALLVVRVQYFPAVPITDISWLNTLGALVAALIVVPTLPAAAFLLSLALWGRGIIHGSDTTGFDDLARAFQRGLLALLAALVIAATTATAGALLAHLAPYALGYVFVGLATLSLIRLESVRVESQARTGSAPPLRRTWLGALAGMIGGLLVLTLMLSTIFSVDLARAVVTPILSFLSLLARAAIMAIALPVAFLVEFLVIIGRQLIGPAQPRPTEQGGGNMFEELQRTSEQLVLPDEILIIIQWVLTGMVVLSALMLLAQAILRQPARRGHGDVDEERESVMDWAGLWALLLAWLRGRTRHEGAGSAPLAPPAVAPAVSPPIATIRQIYASLLRLGAIAGVARAPATTPAEHLPQLQGRVAPPEDVAWLTAAYIRARYGPVPPPSDEVAEAQRHWQRITAQHARETGAGEETPPAPEQG